jgi:hypothetical protein
LFSAVAGTARLLAMGCLLVAGCVLATGCAGEPARRNASVDGSGAVADAGFVRVVRAKQSFDANALGDLATQPPNGEAMLVGPHFVVEFDAIGHATALDETQARRWGLPEAIRAASGHELLLAHTRIPVRESGLGPGRGSLAGPVFQVRVAGQLHGLAEGLAALRTLVVSVPTGADALLAVEDSGRTQTLSLRTGRRGADAIAAYYTARSRAFKLTSGVQVTEPEVTLPSAANNTAPVDVDATVSLLPFTEPDGWATAGRATLRCDIVVVVQYPGLYAALDLARSFSLTLPDGTRLAPQSGTLSIRPAPGGGLQPAWGLAALAFDVPDTTVRGRLAVSPTGAFSMIVTNNQERPVKTRPAEPGTVDFDLGG